MMDFLLSVMWSRYTRIVGLGGNTDYAYLFFLTVFLNIFRGKTKFYIDITIPIKY